MFLPIHSYALGKSNCPCAKGNTYTPSNSSSMDVSFHPVKNPTGTVNYVALIENENQKAKINIPQEMKVEDDDDSCSDDSNENNTKTIDIFSLENDYVKTFYIGSITVVGLYILYRILDKSK